MLSERFGRSLIDATRKQYDELRAKISELEVEKWTKLVDAESKYIVFTIMANLTYHLIVQRAWRDDATLYDQKLRDILGRLNKPIMHMSNQISIIQDKFDSSFLFTQILHPGLLSSF